MSDIPPSPGSGLRLEQDGAVATLVLNRPGRFNALDTGLLDALRQALEHLARHDDVRTLLLTGAGPAFCSGADLAGERLVAAGPDERFLQDVGDKVRASLDHRFNPLIRELVDFPKATVCAVNGMAAGGGVGLALACDIVLAGKSSKFAQVFAPRLGLVPDCGLTWQLPRLVGRSRSAALAMLGDTITADEAERLGLIWRVVDDTRLLGEAGDVARRLAANPAHVNERVKALLRTGAHNSLREQLDLEARVQGECASLPSFAEGVQAFLDKREPTFHRA